MPSRSSTNNGDVGIEEQGSSGAPCVSDVSSRIREYLKRYATDPATLTGKTRMC